MNPVHILIVDDEEDIRVLLQYNLQKEGYQVDAVADGMACMEFIQKQKPNLILLDVMMPVLDGIEVCERIKADAQYQDILICFLTARNEDYSQIAGLDAGADDYITKPFSTRELISRIQAVLKRTNPSAVGKKLVFEELEVDPISHRAYALGQPIDLGPTEYKLLEFFMLHPERAYSRTQLLDQVWGGNVYVEDRTVDVHIRRLRKAINIEGLPELIRTVRSSGYSLDI